jgi:hypothetical protein
MMLWVEIFFHVGGNLLVVGCKVWTQEKHKEIFLVPKWDSLEKHVEKIKNEQGMKVVIGNVLMPQMKPHTF